MALDLEPPTTPTPRWLHRWAVVTVCATLVLLTLGAVVTTFRVGMADPVWPTYPWHLLLIEWEEPRPGFLVEHAHRLAGNVVGCCSLILALGLWHYEARTWLRNLARVLVAGMIGALFLGFTLKTTTAWLVCGGIVLGALAVLTACALPVPDRKLRVRWLATVALGGVILQGMLGGFRVRLDASWGQEFSLVHGFFAQIVFALLASLALVTSRAWESAAGLAAAPRLRRWSVGVAGLLLAQVLLGGFVRHTYWTLGQRLHLLNAFLVVAAVVVLVRLAFEDGRVARPVKVLAAHLAALVALQVSLGVEAWMSRSVYMSEASQGVIRTAHFVVGASIFATAVLTAVRANRRAAVGRPVPPPARARELEAVA